MCIPPTTRPSARAKRSEDRLAVVGDQVSDDEEYAVLESATELAKRCREFVKHLQGRAADGGVERAVPKRQPFASRAGKVYVVEAIAADVCQAPTQHAPGDVNRMYCPKVVRHAAVRCAEAVVHVPYRAPVQAQDLSGFLNPRSKRRCAKPTVEQGPKRRVRAFVGERGGGRSIGTLGVRACSACAPSPRR